MSTDTRLSDLVRAARRLLDAREAQMVTRTDWAALKRAVARAKKRPPRRS